MQFRLRNGIAVDDVRRREERDVSPKLLRVTLGQIDGEGPMIREHREVGHIGKREGFCYCVKRCPEDVYVRAVRIAGQRADEIEYVVKRLGRNSRVSVILQRAEQDNTPYYMLLAAHFFGEVMRPMRTDEKAFAREADPASARADAEQFWSEYVFVLGAHPLRCNRCANQIARSEVWNALCDNFILCPACEDEYLEKANLKDAAEVKRLEQKAAAMQRRAAQLREQAARSPKSAPTLQHNAKELLSKSGRLRQKAAELQVALPEYDVAYAANLLNGTIGSRQEAD